NTNQTYCSGCTRCNAIQSTSSTAIGVAEGKMAENVRMRTSNDDLFIESTGSQNVVCYVTNPFDVSAHVGKKIEVNVVYQGTTQDGFSTTNVNFHYKYSNGDWKQLLNQNSNFLRIVDTAILVISNVAVDDLDDVVDFQLTPNPVDENLLVEYESKVSLEALCYIRNLQGQLIQSHEQILHTGSGKLTIPVRSLAPGFYLFQIADTRGRISTQKFIKS
ncbi:MAG TPA: T9SS type A sorting domain-containing protein, partial [Saprospiraceae bacterium]|nr:T9SS type A sorting domain-containing protein [Saprospiraceae bacterium]